jgi:hypothetical protein
MRRKKLILRHNILFLKPAKYLKKIHAARILK